jgi:ribonuclease E
MAKELLINVAEGEECRIALLDGGKLDELYMERTSSTSHVGNIYKGRVTNVEPSIQAAFVDFGLGRNGFLHISDLMPSYFGRRGDDHQESVGRKMARRDRPPIQRCLRRGDEIIVQIIKEGIGTNQRPDAHDLPEHPRPNPRDDARHEQVRHQPKDRRRRRAQAPPRNS